MVGFYIFCRNAVLIICRYLKGFFTYKKILNNIFLNSLFQIPKIIEIFYIVPAENPD